MSDWISVKDKLPDVKEDSFFGDCCLSSASCLVYNSFGSIFVATFRKWLDDGDHSSYWVEFGRDGYRSEGITHWMPLPLPPSEGE